MELALATRAKLPPQVTAWVNEANKIYTKTGIHFTFNEKDFIPLRSTLLNSIGGVEDANWFDEIAFGDQVAAHYPGKLVIFFRWGSGDQPTGGGFSGFDYNFVATPGFDTTVCGHQNIGALAHEIGHYLGLAHTFLQVFHNSQEAKDFLKANNNDPAAFDGDGLSDTPPDTYIDTYKMQCAPVAGITLNGVTFPLPRDNIMSYYEVRTGLSKMQTERVRWFLALRQLGRMAMPTNAGAPTPLEAQSLPVLDRAGCSAGPQDMSTWGKEQWVNGNQLFVSSNERCTLTLGLPVNRAGRYELQLYLTRSPDFGQIKISVDGTPAGGPIDLYAMAVMPSGAISLGTFDLTQKVHALNFKVVGKNERSSKYSFGVDCLSLIPQP